MPAVPGYVGDRFDGLPPGHRFGLYFRIWRKGDWALEDGCKALALRDVCDIPGPVQKLGEALVQRQKMLARASHRPFLIATAQTTSPLVTGIGLEHPVENGFAFLSPYGLPYLAGSGVKGVLRRAAEEMAAQNLEGWSFDQVWWYFGFEAESSFLKPPGQDEPEVVQQAGREWNEAYRSWAQGFGDPHGLVADLIRHAWPERPDNRTERQYYLEDPRRFLLALQQRPRLRREIHLQGLLSFWDVVPQSQKMDLDILTPHFMDYYQKGKPPWDCGSPLPNPFLVLPPGTRLQFVVGLRARPAIPAALQDSWAARLQSAFRYTHRLGWGAKTGVGYGQLEELNFEVLTTAALASTERAQTPSPGLRADGPSDALQREIEGVVAASAGEPAYSALLRALEEGRWRGEKARQVAQEVRRQMQAAGRWRETTQAKKPEKDHDYQRTLRVKRFLDGGA